eukprot:COSAG05_NODE_4413_length_1526_cov_1.395936_2_plen_130_part_00
MQGLEKMERQAILKPIVGIIVNLFQHGNEEPAKNSLLTKFARHPLLAISAFQFVCSFEWQWGCEVVEGSELRALEQLKIFTELMKKARTDASNLGDELGEIPDEFLDPITMELMEVSRQCSRATWAWGE